MMNILRALNIRSLREPQTHDPTNIGGLLLVSLLVMLNLPLVMAGITGMDQYGFFTLELIAVRPIPLALSAGLNIALAGLVYLAYSMSRRQLWRFRARFWGPFKRHGLIIGAPVALATMPSFLLTSHGGKPFWVVVAVLMSGSLCITAALRDEDTWISPRFVNHWSTLAAGAIAGMLILSVAGMLLLYAMEPPAPRGNFFWEWDFNWADLGYPPEQFAQRQHDGLAVFVLMGCAYMIVALGGAMISSILKSAHATQTKLPTSSASEVIKPTPHGENSVDQGPLLARRRAIRQHLDRLADENGHVLRDIDIDAAWAIAESDSIKGAASKMRARKHGVLTQGVDEKTVGNRANAILERTGLREEPGLQPGDLRGYLLALK